MMTRRGWLSLAAALLTAGLCFAPPSWGTTDTVAKLRSSGTIVLGYRESAAPFSFAAADGQPIGYAVDLCVRAVELMRTTLALPALAVRWQPVTSANRIPLLTKGSIDIECGSTSNTAERQRRVAFGPNYFISRIAVAVLADSGITSLAQAAGKPVATATGTTSAIAIKHYEQARGIELKDFYTRDHQQAFEALVAGRAAAVVLDHVLLAGFIANAKDPSRFRLLDDSLGAEAYAPMLRRDDAAFKKLVGDAFGEIMRSGEAERLYEKWFNSPIPPGGVNMRMPLTPALKALFQAPRDEPI